MRRFVRSCAVKLGLQNQDHPVTGNTLSGAGNTPSCDDRSSGRSLGIRDEKLVASGPLGAFYDFSITYTKTQRLRNRVCLRSRLHSRYASNSGVASSRLRV